MEPTKIVISKIDPSIIAESDDAIALFSFLEKDSKSLEMTEIKKKLWGIVNKNKALFEDRTNLFYCTLTKCWKVYVDDEHIAYIYPYDINEYNKLLFCLYSPTEHRNNYFVDHNGLYERSIDTAEWFIKHDVTLISCSLDEMLENAKTMCEKCLQRRLDKIEKKKI
jgi:hypothetical protein